MSSIHCLVGNAPYHHLQDYLTVADITNLRAANKQFNVFISSTLSKRKKRQISLLAQYLLTQLGKPIIESWRKHEPESRSFTKDALLERVHGSTYPEQSKALKLFSKTVMTSPLCDECLKAELVDILSEPVFTSHERSFLLSPEHALDSLIRYLEWDILNEVHVFQNLTVPSHLLPKNWEDIQKLSIEELISKFVTQIQDLPLLTSPIPLFSTQLACSITQDDKNKLLYTLAMRCASLSYLIPCMLTHLNTQEERSKVLAQYDRVTKENEQRRLKNLFENYADKQNFDLAFEVGLGLSNWSDYLMQAIFGLIKQGKERKALLLILNSLEFFKMRKAWWSKFDETPPWYREVEKEYFDFFNNFLLLTCHFRGIDKAVALIEIIPYREYRNYLINMLILRLACPDIYIKRFHVPWIQHYSLGERIVLLTCELEESIRKNRNLDKAIELFNEFKKYEHPSEVEICTAWRSVYIIEALLEAGRKEEANKFLANIKRLNSHERESFLGQFRDTWFRRFKEKMLDFKIDPYPKVELK